MTLIPRPSSPRPPRTPATSSPTQIRHHTKPRSPSSTPFDVSPRISASITPASTTVPVPTSPSRPADTKTPTPLISESPTSMRSLPSVMPNSHPQSTHPASGSGGLQPSSHRKPRTWAATLRRHASTIAAHLSTSSPRPTTVASDDHSIVQPHIPTQSDFRRSFLKSSRERLLVDDTGSSFRLVPIVMNGDCGFAAIARGINIARDKLRAPPATAIPSFDRLSRRPRQWFRFVIADSGGGGGGRRRGGSGNNVGVTNDTGGLRTSPGHGAIGTGGGVVPKRSLQPKDIRLAMYSEIREAKKTYLADLHSVGPVFTDADFTRLEREVSRPGIAGHWLGTVLGVLEHVIIAHALNINIYLFQFDLAKQRVRQFESATVENPDCKVYLFFTGPPACGHFDALVKVSDSVRKTNSPPDA